MRILVTEEAKKQYKRLSKTEQTKIKKKLFLLKNAPHTGKKLTGSLAGLRSLKAWPYRILYNIDGSRETIVIVSIQHRQGAYK